MTGARMFIVRLHAFAISGGRSPPLRNPTRRKYTSMILPRFEDLMIIVLRIFASPDRGLG